VVPAEHPVTVLQLYGRSYCHLCTEMADALAGHIQGYPVHVEWIDLDEHEEWEGRFGEHIPVLCHGEQELCRHRLDPAALGAFLARFG
jgi:thioredoxin reductase (NADPH)